MTPLILAKKAKNEEIISILLNAGADLDFHVKITTNIKIGMCRPCRVRVIIIDIIHTWTTILILIIQADKMTALMYAVEHEQGM